MRDLEHDISMIYSRVELEPLTLKDAMLLRQLRNSRSECFINSEPIDEEKQIRWYKRYLAQENDYMFSVRHIASNKWIGAVGIYDISAERDEAQFGRLIVDGKRVNERGLGVDTTKCACKIAFEALGINRLFLEVYEDNTVAIKTYERAGFTQYGSIHDDNKKRLITMQLYRKEVKLCQPYKF